MPIASRTVGSTSSEMTGVSIVRPPLILFRPADHERRADTALPADSHLNPRRGALLASIPLAPPLSVKKNSSVLSQIRFVLQLLYDRTDTEVQVVEHGHEDGAVLGEVREPLAVTGDVLRRRLLGRMNRVVGQVQEERLISVAIDEGDRFFGQASSEVALVLDTSLARDRSG